MGRIKAKFDKEHIGEITKAQNHMQKYILRKRNSMGDVVDKKFSKMLSDKELIKAFNKEMEKEDV